MNSFSHLTSEYLNKCKKVDDNKYLFPFFKVKIRNKYREEYKNKLMNRESLTTSDLLWFVKLLGDNEISTDLFDIKHTINTSSNVVGNLNISVIKMSYNTDKYTNNHDIIITEYKDVCVVNIIVGVEYKDDNYQFYTKSLGRKLFEEINYEDFTCFKSNINNEKFVSNINPLYILPKVVYEVIVNP